MFKTSFKIIEMNISKEKARKKFSLLTRSMVVIDRFCFKASAIFSAP